MQARLLQFWDSVRSSYWFIPLILTLGAIVLSFVTGALDRAYDHEWMDGIPWLFESRPDGAREILSTIAGSMITVAGVVFSITMVAVVYASGQHGARLLTNFMRDTGNQVTLGTFIATFLYCILVLRSVRGPEELQEIELGAELSSGFVPHLGMLVALVLTLCSVGVLIYFIHHVPLSIHISNVIAGIGVELRDKVESRFPESLGQPRPDEVDPRGARPDDFALHSTSIESDGSGYIQAVDEDELFQIAVDNDMLLVLHSRPGVFVRPGKALLEAYPEDRVTDEVIRRVRLSFAWGRQRTPMQDYMFLVNELVEIGVRALSPGINDPFTAVSCIDWLADGVASFSTRDMPDRYRFDDEDTLRVIAHPISLDEFVEAALGQIAPYAAVDRIAGLHLLSVIGELSDALDSDEGRAILRRYADRVMRGAEAELDDPGTLAIFEDRYRDVLRLLRRDPGDGAAARDAKWMAESS